MALVKHGDGNVLPENDQQKTAKAMDPKEAAALAKENAEADGDHDSD